MIDITPDPGPQIAAAIVAALMRLEEESRAAASVPPDRPLPARWVTAATPRAVHPPHVTRPVLREDRSGAD